MTGQQREQALVDLSQSQPDSGGVGSGWRCPLNGGITDEPPAFLVNTPNAPTLGDSHYRQRGVADLSDRHHRVCPLGRRRRNS